MSDKHKVFVYGTLRNGQPATHKLPDFEMYKYNSGNFAFPYIVPVGWDDNYESGAVFVLGNIVEVDDKELAKLDKYENVASGLFKRVEVSVWSTQLRPDAKNTHYSYGTKVNRVWVYVAGPALVNKRIDSGDWLSR